MRNRMYGGVRGRKMKVGGKLLHFPPTRLVQQRCNIPHFIILLEHQGLNYYFPEATFVWTNSTNNTLLL